MISRLLPFLAILIAIGLFFGYINPTYTGSIAALNAEVENYNSALAAAKAFAEKETQLIEVRNAIPAAGIERLETFLPDGVDNVQLILDLDALATRSGVKLSNFEMEAEQASGQVGSDTLPLTEGIPADSLPLSVSATGTYGAFRTFLQSLEQSLRPLDLVSMSLADSETGVYTYDMTFMIYWLR